MKKFKNRYRIPSACLQSWDYGKNGSYFVTICTKNRAFYFGDVACGIMKLSQIGQMAKKYWLEIPNHFPFVKLGEYVIMPNHVHGIIIIDKPDNGMNRKTNVKTHVETHVETQNLASLQQRQQPHNHPKNQFGPQSQNLASIVRGFKIGVTKNAKKINAEFIWQSRFHDHIIRNEKSFNEITEYVKTNPQKWENDKFYAEGNRRDANGCTMK
jgi:REP element-mobilizing transposase RayT